MKNFVSEILSRTVAKYAASGDGIDPYSLRRVCMLITAIESSVVALPFDMGGPKPLFAGQPWDHLEILVVKVETDDGLVGWGEAFGHAAIPATKTALDTIVAPLCIGRDAGDINALSRAILHGTHLLGRNGPFVYAYSGIEIGKFRVPPRCP